MEIAILGGCRTPFCKAGTLLRDIPADELACLACREAFYRLEIDPSQVDETIVGNVAQPMEAANIARVVALKSGVPRDRPAMTVHRNCASGFEAVTTAAERILSGQAEVVLAAGTESMSNIPLVYPKPFADIVAGIQKAKTFSKRVAAVWRIRPRHFKPVSALMSGLTDPFSGMLMGETAELLAREWGISRKEQDEFALRSHRRALEAQRLGKFDGEILTVFVPPGYGDRIARDNGPRQDASLEGLARLRPFFNQEEGTVTVGNSCPVTDGAVALILMSGERARRMNLKPLGYLRGYAYAGLDPERMGLGPVYATPKALDRAGLKMSDIGLIELNEAFAAQVLANLRAFDSRPFAREKLGRADAVGPLEPERLNVNGGGIALGHPVGATGARLVLGLLHEMRRRDVAFGLATLCVGGGMGGALVLERR
ncbi:MAG: thiolase family protein [Planctomycetes bacterium]|nr:thiolase family protein [Planctomycetota bacterium]